MHSVLAEHYGLVDAALSPIGTGAVNQNTRVEIPGATYVLKRYEPRLFRPEQVARTCEVQASLGRQGLPVPTIIPNARGALVTNTAGACFVLSSFVHGRHYRRGEIPQRAAVAMGRTLGRLVQALADLRPVESYQVPDPVERSARINLLLAAAERASGAVDAVACQVLRYKLGALERLQHLVPRFASLPVQWVHGDYQETNVLFDAADEVAAVIDFDNLRCRPRGYECMRAFAYAFTPGSDEQMAFFRGFAEIVVPPAAEVALYAPLWAYCSAASLWPIESRYLEPAVYQPRWDRFIRPPSDWWERNMETVTAQLLEALREKYPPGA